MSWQKSSRTWLFCAEFERTGHSEFKEVVLSLSSLLSGREGSKEGWRKENYTHNTVM